MERTFVGSTGSKSNLSWSAGSRVWMYRYHSGKLPLAMASTRSCRANAPSGDLAASAGMSLSSRFFSPVQGTRGLQCPGSQLIGRQAAVQGLGRRRLVLLPSALRTSSCGLKANSCLSCMRDGKCTATLGHHCM